MTLRNFYIFMLYCSGLILMAHIFVPHQHNISISKKESVHKHESSHHDDHHGHHHHKKASDEEPASDSPISHPIHQENITKFVMKQTTVSVEVLKVMYILPEYINTTLPVLIKISTVHYKPDKNNLNPSCYRSCFALRGPPTMLFS